MAGHSYPHIVFAKDAGVLPQSRLEEILGEVVPSGRVEHGEIKSDLTLDGWTYTFWYDDDADGLGEHYADYAAPLRRKRVTRCTTMIDASGAADVDAAHAEQVERIMSTLAAQDGVYVFSELTKRFVGMDYDDETGGVAHAPALQLEADPRSEVSPPAHATPEASEVFLGAHESFPHADPRTDESHLPGAREHVGDPHVAPADHPLAAPAATTAEPQRATPAPEPVVEPVETFRPAVSEPQVSAAPAAPSAPAATPEPVVATPVETPQPAVVTPAEPEPTRPVAADPAPVTAAPTVAPEPSVPVTTAEHQEHAPAASALDTARPTPAEPAAPATAERLDSPEEPEKKGFFKKLFGRKR